MLGSRKAKIHLSRSSAFAVLALHAVMLRLSESRQLTLPDVGWIDLQPASSGGRETRFTHGFTGPIRLTNGETLGVSMSLTSDARECHIAIASLSKQRTWAYLVYFEENGQLQLRGI